MLQGYDSVYLERINKKVSIDNHFDDIEHEVLAEMAAAVRQTDQKLNFAMLTMQIAEEELDVAVEKCVKDEEETALVAKFNEARKTAEEMRRNLMIHRQSCGFTTDNHRMIMKLYPIPERRRVGVAKKDIVER